MASEDEWYKAAYYKGGGKNAGYWDYATQSNLSPSNIIRNPDGGNNANYHLGPVSDPYCRTNVGEFENSDSYYGTFDQVGNVWEWNDTIVNGVGDRGIRGGSYYYRHSNALTASARGFQYPSCEYPTIGFRVVSSVPEPSSIFALLSGIGGLALLKIRRKRL